MPKNNLLALMMIQLILMPPTKDSLKRILTILRLTNMKQYQEQTMANGQMTFYYNKE
ncbi:hypothetical protein MHBO_000196 [Bonamia ostreae]|uniref:Uncharacterized protein n=1 Tax=Bonamia ostreae TaxID=126728 RepID=A0ABV2AER2_9EUKA